MVHITDFDSRLDRKGEIPTTVSYDESGKLVGIGIERADEETKSKHIFRELKFLAEVHIDDKDSTQYGYDCKVCLS